MSIDVAALFLAAGRVLLIGLLFGAGLPALFAWGLRLRAAGTGQLASAGSGAAPALTDSRRRGALALSTLLFAIVIAAVLVGVLYITRHSLEHYFHLSLFGA